MNKVVLKEDFDALKDIIDKNITDIQNLLTSNKNSIINVNTDFSNGGVFTTIIDINALVDANISVLNSAIIDVINTGLGNVNYKIFSGANHLQQGVIGPGRVLSFETQKQDLSVQVDGSGNVKATIRYLRFAL